MTKRVRYQVPHYKGDDIPGLGDLLAPPTQAERDNPFTQEGIETTRQHLAEIEREITRVNADFAAGKTRMKFDPNLLYSRNHAWIAHKYHVDYVGVTLLLNEKYERNPIKFVSRQQARKKWFNDRYRTENELRDYIGATLRRIIFLKMEVALHQVTLRPDAPAP